MTFVVDSSVALAWFIPDERDPVTDALLEKARIEGVHVPALWPIEIANVLLKVERRGRSSPSLRRQALDGYSVLPLTVDADVLPRVWSVTLDLAERHALTVYDACYLELALRLGLPLATRDRQLRGAAERTGVAVLG